MIAIPWIYVPMASKLGLRPSNSLAMTAHLTSWNDAIIDVFAYTLPDAVFATITSLPNLSASKDLSDNVWSSEQRLDSPV